ncbi:MAG: hypothetical protein FWD64_02250 [Acidobacteriaceae bacterium]|nr:hypothetical protein [Acidobacteriaceae bacterium]
MKRLLVLFPLFALFALTAAAEQLIPAGSVVQCLVAEPHLSSKTVHLGDPVLCQVSYSEMYGRSVFPYGSYLIGRFEDYKDPGHLFGKGWMELKFDRMLVGNDTIIPVQTRVIATTSKNRVDRDGRIHGRGHPVRDTIEWMIPVLWPIDLINLPRRGPYPELKPESRLTVLVLDDFGIPTRDELQHRQQVISRYNDDPAPQRQPLPAPTQPEAAPQAYPQSAPVIIIQTPAPPPGYIQPPAVVYRYPPPPPPPMYSSPPVVYGGYFRPYPY